MHCSPILPLKLSYGYPNYLNMFLHTFFLNESYQLHITAHASINRILSVVRVMMESETLVFYHNATRRHMSETSTWIITAVKTSDLASEYYFPVSYTKIWRLKYTYLLIYLLTPWCRTLFEKLIVTQLIKNILLSLWNPKVHYRVHESPLLEPILSQPNPIRPIDHYLRFSLMLSSHLRLGLSSGLSLSGLPTKTL
jgi:hypothetical protein